jgi:hypothetical protein
MSQDSNDSSNARTTITARRHLDDTGVGTGLLPSIELYDLISREGHADGVSSGRAPRPNRLNAIVASVAKSILKRREFVDGLIARLRELHTSQKQLSGWAV